MSDNIEEDLTAEEETLLGAFLEDLDDTIFDYLDSGLAYDLIGATMMSRISQLYTLGDNPDFEGLESLFEMFLSEIKDRPDWPTTN